MLSGKAISRAIQGHIIVDSFLDGTGWSKKRKTVEWKFPFNFYPFFGPRGKFSAEKEYRHEQGPYGQRCVLMMTK